MLPQGQRFFSETQRRSFAEGEAKGKTEGRAEGHAQAILRVLERRNVAVSAEQREQILSCSDLVTLGAWLDRAVTGESAKEMFVESTMRRDGHR